MFYKVILLFCVVLYETTDCTTRTNQKKFTRKVQRRHVGINNNLNLQSTTLSNETSNFNEKIINVLGLLESKLSQIDNLFIENKNENSRLVLVEDKINNLDNKISELINDNKKYFNDGRYETRMILKMSEQANFKNIIREIQESYVKCEEKVQHNLSEYGDQVDCEQRCNKNISDPDEFSMQIQRNQRKERRVADEQNLINKILSMVKTKLKTNEEDEDPTNNDNSSLTNIVKSIENIKSPVLVSEKKKTNLTTRGIIFPNVKNKPAKLNMTFMTDRDIRGFSCVELMNAGMRQSGVYYLQSRETTYWYLQVFCEQEIANGGWTVIQRRDDFGEPRENFNRDWGDYKNGFGDPAKEFWMGNENIYMLTNNEDYALRIELEDFEGNIRFAQYSHFKVHSEVDYYKLEIDGYEGNAGDSLNDITYGSNMSPFSTYNRDNDRSSLNCASMLKGGWWWKSCGRGLNGLYLSQDFPARQGTTSQGIIWFTWRGWDYPMKRTKMMIKPREAIEKTRISAAERNEKQ